MSLSAQIGIFKSTFSPLSLSVFFTKLVSNLGKLLFLSFFNMAANLVANLWGYLCLLALVFLPIMAANLVANLEASI